LQKNYIISINFLFFFFFFLIFIYLTLCIIFKHLLTSQYTNPFQHLIPSQHTTTFHPISLPISFISIYYPFSLYLYTLPPICSYSSLIPISNYFNISFILQLTNLINPHSSSYLSSLYPLSSSTSTSTITPTSTIHIHINHHTHLHHPLPHQPSHPPPPSTSTSTITPTSTIHIHINHHTHLHHPLPHQPSHPPFPSSSPSPKSQLHTHFTSTSIPFITFSSISKFTLSISEKSHPIIYLHSTTAQSITHVC
jgi:hypothetical protein